MKTLVAYYSHGGNNRFIAEKLAKDLGGDLVELSPRVKPFGFVLLASLTRLSLGNRKVRFPVADYDAVVLCGPIYMGMLVAPLRDFMKANRKKLKSLHFATCCGGGEEEKDTKFGYNAVFGKARAILGERLAGCTALSIDLFAADELKGHPDGIMSVKLTEEKFTGAFADRYADLVRAIKKAE